MGCAVPVQTGPPREVPGSSGSAGVLRLHTVVGLVRLVGAVVCAAALVARFVWGLGSVTFTASNFFAYLTIQSNIAFVFVTLTAGIVAIRGPREPAWLTTARATVLSCTVSAGAVFALLIEQAGVRGLPLDVQPDDELKQAQRSFFVALYRLICGADTGPRIPTLLLSLGKEKVKALLAA